MVEKLWQNFVKKIKLKNCEKKSWKNWKKNSKEIVEKLYKKLWKNCENNLVSQSKVSFWNHCVWSHCTLCTNLVTVTPPPPATKTNPCFGGFAPAAAATGSRHFQSKCARRQQLSADHGDADAQNDGGKCFLDKIRSGMTWWHGKNK